MSRLFLSLVFSLGYIWLFAQDVAIGEWRSYAPYRNAISITQNATTIFLANELTIMAIEKSDNSVRFLSKENGLSDSNIKMIKHHPTLDAMVVAYTNSNVDLIFEGQVINLNFIKTNANLSGDRSINNISFFGGFAYLSTAFGLVEMEIERAEFRNTVFTGIAVNDVEVYDDLLWMATDDGIYTISPTSTNIADFGLWTFLDSDFGFPVAYSSEAIRSFGNQLYVDVNGGVFRYANENLTIVAQFAGFQTQYLSNEDQYLVIGKSCNSGCSTRVFFLDENGSLTEAGQGCINFNFGAILSDDVVYYADLFSDLRRSDGAGNPCSQFAFDSPGSRNVSDIEVDGTEVYIASGGRTIIGDNSNLADGVFFNLGDGWRNYNQFNVPEFVTFGAERDFIQIKKNPVNGKVYIASYFRGLIEFDKGSWTIFGANNSSLQEVVGFPGRVRVGSLDIDSQGNVWMTNHLAPRPISVYKVDGTWQSFELPGSNAVANITVDAFDNKWITSFTTSQGITVFDEGEFDTNQDDRFKTFNASNSQLSTSVVNFIASDLDGIVWAGTGEGVITFECGDGVFDDFCVGTERIVDVGANRDRLLRTENVRTIGVDGGNRKWFGTDNGIFVQSADGEEQVFRFTSENSPLYSNTIIDFGFNLDNGEVFIGSTSGVQSYRSDATLGSAVHLEEADIFPNPIRDNYDGDISISNLAQNANVKISDVQGRIVFETQANGGTATWDGRNFEGQKVVPGVYLVYSTVQNNLGQADTLVGKMLIIR